MTWEADLEYSLVAFGQIARPYLHNLLHLKDEDMLLTLWGIERPGILSPQLAAGWQDAADSYLRHPAATTKDFVKTASKHLLKSMNHHEIDEGLRRQRRVRRVRL